jgi:NAD(P)-dependent dehydrogenase (short-subunit alcohol dehydrogenase family)
LERFSIFDLTGKVAIVTGGYHGIGRGIAEGLAEAGSNIVICARNYDRCVEACSEIEKMGVKAFPIQCDIRKAGDVENLITQTIQKMGKINILVNNAGVGGSEKPVLEMSDEEWDDVMNIDLRGAFFCSRAAVKEMIKQAGGKIINVASIMAFITTANMSAYCASKGGMVQLTKTMALEFIKYNIQVNALCPGYFLTPLNRKLFESEMGKRIIQKNIPMGRIGKCEELRGTAIYLASSATDFMTGACIVVDGGQILW